MLLDIWDNTNVSPRALDPWIWAQYIVYKRSEQFTQWQVTRSNILAEGAHASVFGRLKSWISAWIPQILRSFCVITAWWHLAHTPEAVGRQWLVQELLLFVTGGHTNRITVGAGFVFECKTRNLLTDVTECFNWLVSRDVLYIEVINYMFYTYSCALHLSGTLSAILSQLPFDRFSWSFRYGTSWTFATNL